MCWTAAEDAGPHRGLVRSRSNQLNLVTLSALWLLGAAIFSGMPGTDIVFFPLAYLALVLAFVTTNRQWHDGTNPLSVVLVLGFVRFGISGLLQLMAVNPDLDLFHTMRLDDTDWLLGHALALLGLLGVVIGWQIPSKSLGSVFRRTARRVNVRLTRGVRYAAVAGMVVGFIALMAFVASNAPLGDVVRTGDFRRTEIQVGTGIFFWLSLMLIASSVVLAAYLMATDRAWWVSLLPVCFATVLFWALGGRVRAITPFATGLLLLWYRKGRPGLSAKSGALLVIALLPVVLLAGQLYRGGLGVEGIGQAFSIEGVSGYIQSAVWVDWGQLYALAGATAIGPAVLDGGTFLKTFLWPLSEYVFSISGRSAGVFLAEHFVGFGSGKPWAFHSSLIGDAYLNFGLAGVLIATVIFGILLKRLYIGWKEGWIQGPVYLLSLLYGTRIFFESVEKFTEAWIVVAMTVVVVRAGQLTFRPALGARAVGRPVTSRSPLAPQFPSAGQVDAGQGAIG
jgi:oligosaccharide repeat unit polymerase